MCQDNVTDELEFSSMKHCHKCEPLYTHPAKELDEQFKKGFEAGSVEGWKAHKFLYPAKTLTDEEIEELAMEYLENTGKGIVGVYDFVRAILKKANNG